MIKIVQNDNIELVRLVREGLRQNKGYCPCKLEKIPENKCVCKDFRELEQGECHCGLYVKIKT